AGTARARFDLARTALADLDWRTVRPALMMYGVYLAYLDRLEARGWASPRAPVRLPSWAKAWIALRRALIPVKPT
ncbi:MAG: squalene/phytoene synthase family protein, partial [Caulobacterales bacterium]|nr:squalene/phytoene synthase family protein [Caulobacterales bacterium]